MKKYLLFIALGLLMFASGISPASAQVKYIWAKGAKGVDSIAGATSKYYTLPPVTGYTKAAIQVYVTRSVITGTDSTHITFEGSIDNVTWYKLDVGTPVTSGGATWITAGTYIKTLSVQANGGALYAVPSDIYFPYIRMKVNHWKAACNVYSQAWVYFKKP